MNATAVGRPHAGLLEWLRQHAVEYEIHEHDAASTAVSTALAEGVDARTFAKVVGVTTNDGRRALLLVDAPDRVDLRKAEAVLGAAEVGLLTEDELAALAPGCEAGAMPAVGSLFGLVVYADHAIKEDSEISFNAGTHRFSVRVDRASWERAADVHYADLAVDLDAQPAWARS